MKVIVKAKIETVNRYHCVCPFPQGLIQIKNIKHGKFRMITKKYHAFYEGMKDI